MSHQERLDIIRAWLGEEAYLRLEQAAARSKQEVEAYVVEKLLDCVDASEDAEGTSAIAVGSLRPDLPPRPRDLPRLNAARRRALEAIAGGGRGGNPRATAWLIDHDLVEENLEGRRVTPRGQDELARIRAEQIAYEHALDEEP